MQKSGVNLRMFKGMGLMVLALAASTATAGEEILRLNEAKEAFTKNYLPAKANKAFAQAPDGTWGWAADRTSPRAATEDALATCTKNLPPKSKPCVVVHVDQWWTEAK